MISPIAVSVLAFSVAAAPMPQSGSPRCMRSPKEHLDWFNRASDGSIWGTDDGVNSCKYQYCADAGGLSYHEPVGKLGLEWANENINGVTYSCIVGNFFPACVQYTGKGLWHRTDQPGSWFTSDEKGYDCTVIYCDPEDLNDGQPWNPWPVQNLQPGAYKWVNAKNRICLRR